MFQAQDRLRNKAVGRQYLNSKPTVRIIIGRKNPPIKRRPAPRF